MAAYAAVVSLQHTLKAILKFSSPRITPIRDILESANKEASSLLHALEGLNGSNRSRSSMERVDALDAQIRDSAHKLEDALEFFELKQLQLKEGDEEGVMRQEIRSFGEAAKRLVKEYLAELSREDDDDEYTAYPDFGVEMIGRSGLAKTVVFLSKSDMTVEEWSKIAADKDNPIFTIVDELSECSEIKNEIEYRETN